MLQLRSFLVHVPGPAHEAVDAEGEIDSVLFLRPPVVGWGFTTEPGTPLPVGADREIRNDIHCSERTVGLGECSSHMKPRTAKPVIVAEWG